MPSKLRLRPASEADIEALILISAHAFAGSPRRAILFPEHLRIKPVPGDDENDFRRLRLQSQLKEPNYRISVAVEDGDDGKEEVVGWAIWTSPYTPGTEPTKEEKEAKHKKLMDSASKALDIEASKRLEECTDNWVKSVMGEEGTKNYWILRALGVHPNHQRKGAGRLLAQWGVDEATKEGKDVWLIATPVGRKLYETMGFEILSEIDDLGELTTIMVSKRKEVAE